MTLPACYYSQMMDNLYKLTHPKYEVSKVYIAEVKGILSNEEIERFETGLQIGDYITTPAKLIVKKCSEIYQL